MTDRNTRDEFPQQVVRALQERVGNRCSSPDCRRLTSGPNFAPEKATRIGVAAHITAAAPGGPRYDPSLTSEERRSIHNGIWLCQSCARLIDVDPTRYSVLRLLKWRQEAEQAALDELEGKKPREPEEPPQKEGWICPFCKTIVEFDQTVCLGCHAEVVYGATRAECEQAAKAGLMIGGALAAFLLLVLPGWLSSQLSWQVPLGFGLGIFALSAAGVLTLPVVYGCVQAEESRHRKQPPRFFRSTVA
jgi:hypothetical protein